MRSRLGLGVGAGERRGKLSDGLAFPHGDNCACDRVPVAYSYGQPHRTSTATRASEPSCTRFATAATVSADPARRSSLLLLPRRGGRARRVNPTEMSKMAPHWRRQWRDRAPESRLAALGPPRAHPSEVAAAAAAAAATSYGHWQTVIERDEQSYLIVASVRGRIGMHFRVPLRLYKN